MKKIYILLSILSISFTSFCQIFSDGAIDNFESTFEHALETTEKEVYGNGFAYKGIFWWKGNFSSGFKSNYSRLGDGELTYTITHPEKLYEKIGFGFGEYLDLHDKKQNFTVNLENDANLKFVLINKSNFDISVKIGLEDINGITLEHDKEILTGYYDGDIDLYGLYKYEIGPSVMGSSIGGIPFKKDHIKPNDTLFFSYNYKNAISANYFIDSTSDYPNCAFEPRFNCGDGTCFDYSKVKSVYFIIRNSKVILEPESCYGPEKFEGNVVFKNLSLGRSDKITSTKADNKNQNINVFPNPAVDVLYFQNAEKNDELRLLDLVGHEKIRTTLHSNQISIDKFSKGLHFYEIYRNGNLLQNGKIIIQ